MQYAAETLPNWQGMGVVARLYSLVDSYSSCWQRDGAWSLGLGRLGASCLPGGVNTVHSMSSVQEERVLREVLLLVAPSRVFKMRV